MNPTSFPIRVVVVWLFVLAAFCPGATAQSILNGGFEANGGPGATDFSDWVVADAPGSAGSFYVQTGTGSPVFGADVPAPPEGEFAAMSEAGGPGAHVLYQDFLVPSVVGSAKLRFRVFVQNQAGDFTAPGSLDFDGAPNQQARVDLLRGASDPFSVQVADVLLNLYQTRPGDPLTSGYTLVSLDVTSVVAAHKGETLRLRFAEVDNLQPLLFGVDDVQWIGSAAPEPAGLALLALAAPLASVALRRRRL